jgi:hypothetical protein
VGKLLPLFFISIGIHIIAEQGYADTHTRNMTVLVDKLLFFGHNILIELLIKINLDYMGMLDRR